MTSCPDSNPLASAPEVSYTDAPATAGGTSGMIGAADGNTAGAPLTHVILTWREGRQENWLRFGKPVGERIIDRSSRTESYAPGQVFALVGWASNDYGTVHSTLHILRAVGPGSTCSTFPRIDPGAQQLLTVCGWPRVRRVLCLIDAIETAGIDPCDVAPDYWCHVHNRLASRTQPRPYTSQRHAVWLARKDVRP